MKLLRALAHKAKRRAHRDGTVYGTSRSSTTSFFIHHLAAIASAVVRADALTLENAAATYAFMTTLAATPRASAATRLHCA